MRLVSTFTLSLFCLSTAYALNKPRSLKVSGLFTDHMVLQQMSKITIWGESSPDREILIRTGWNVKGRTVCGKNGRWKVLLRTPKAGGPYSVEIKDRNSKITIKDILIGEIWVASGQSNMDIPLKGWPPGDTIFNSAAEIRNADYPNIRLFKVPFKVSATPVDSVLGKWVIASSATTGDFSATAYFFARSLYRELHIPIGIIQSSIGGTPVEAWTSKAALKSVKDFNSEIQRLDTIQALTQKWKSQWPAQPVPEKMVNWFKIDFSDLVAADSEYDDSGWSTLQLPGRVDRLPSGELDGAIWVRKKFEVTDISTQYTVKIGSIDDMDQTYINGTKIGVLTGPGFANTLREMTIPIGLLRLGSNVIAIKIVDTGGQAFVRGPLDIFPTNGDPLSLQGGWKSRPVAEVLNSRLYIYGLQKDITLRPNMNELNSNLPTVLFNAMINPLISFKFKGVIWYQGESNVGRAEQYKRSFPAMITDWRDKWHTMFPFYYVQIAPYNYPARDQAGQSAKLRDAQRYGLSLPKTGMVSTLDIGYLKTAHPPYKQEVGNRLAKLALKYQYNRDIVPCGPMFKSVKQADGKLIVYFSYTGMGLVVGPCGLNNFEVAGVDKIYHKAEAIIESNTVVVSSPLIKFPVYVRYAWSDSSSATLFNREGLPAATFTSEK
jgi:sialate O-acetylesterase